MARAQKYVLIYSPDFEEHLAFIDTKYYSLIREKIEEQLQFEPGVATRNRKPLRPQTVLNAKWELRFGPDNRFRVFYVFDEVLSEVYITAVGEKRREQLWIGGEETTL